MDSYSSCWPKLVDSYGSCWPQLAVWFLFREFFILWPDFWPTSGLFGENCLSRLVLVWGRYKLWANNFFLPNFPFNLNALAAIGMAFFKSTHCLAWQLQISILCLIWNLLVSILEESSLTITGTINPLSHNSQLSRLLNHSCSFSCPLLMSKCHRGRARLWLWTTQD